MMETEMTSKSVNCPDESPPAPTTKSNSKIGRIKIRTPAEINKEFEGTPNSESASMSVDSSDQLRAFSFSDFLRPPDPSPSSPVISTVSKLKESPAVSQLKVSSSQLAKPKRKSKYPGLFEKIKNKVGTSSFSKSVSKPASVSGSHPMSALTRPYPMVSSVTRSFLTPSKAVISYSTPASDSTSFLAPSSVITPVPTPASIATSVPTPASIATSVPTPASIATSVPTPVSIATSSKSVPHEAGSGTRRNYPGFGETESRSQGNRLKEHRISDADARNIQASWQKLKPTEVRTSDSVSKSSAPGSSNSQVTRDHAGDSLPKIREDNPRLPEPQTSPERLNPGIEKEKHYQTSFPTKSTDLQVNEKTKDKGSPSSGSKTAEPTELNFYRESSKSTFKSVPNKSGVQESNIRKKYRGFGEITTSKDSQLFEKTRNKRFSSSDKSAKRHKGTMQEKASSKSISSIHKLDEISKSREEDWDSSLRQWIPSEPNDHVQKRKVQKVKKLPKSKTRKNKSSAGVRSRFEKTNLQQDKIQKSRARKGIYLSGEISIDSQASIANISTEPPLEDFSSECTEKLDKNDNNVKENFEVQKENTTIVEVKFVSDDYVLEILDQNDINTVKENLEVKNENLAISQVKFVLDDNVLVNFPGSGYWPCRIIRVLSKNWRKVEYFGGLEVGKAHVKVIREYDEGVKNNLERYISKRKQQKDPMLKLAVKQINESCVVPEI